MTENQEFKLRLDWYNDRLAVDVALEKHLGPIDPKLAELPWLERTADRIDQLAQKSK